MIDTGWLSRLVTQGTELHVRSVFLQGLFLMPSGRRPAMFARWAPPWTAFDLWLHQAGLTPVQACLRDALSFPEIAKVILGVDSLPHLTDILQAADGPAPQIPEVFRTDDADLLNPACWAAFT